jgi:hypothetical protein
MPTALDGGEASPMSGTASGGSTVRARLAEAAIELTQIRRSVAAGSAATRVPESDGGGPFTPHVTPAAGGPRPSNHQRRTTVARSADRARHSACVRRPGAEYALAQLTDNGLHRSVDECRFSQVRRFVQWR